MDDRRFDSLTRGLAQGTSRRSLIKGLLGLGGVAATGVVLHDTQAARRGYSGPPTLAPLPTQTAQPTTIPTQSPTSTNIPAPTATPTNTPNSCGASGVCCTGNSDCYSIPTYCESTAQYPLLWRYQYCNYNPLAGTGFCAPTAHTCENARHNCEIDVCDDQTGCAVAPVTPGQMGSEGSICCTDNSHCAGLPRYCDAGGGWHYSVCGYDSCEEIIQQCGAGQCQEPIGCQIIGPG